MERKDGFPGQLHYHIRWSGKRELDWESFDSRAEAEAGARELVRLGETFTIEEHGEGCPRCRPAVPAKSKHGNEMKYPDWQGALWDALSETNPKQLHDKIGRAEVAIKERLLELSRILGHHEETRAIHDALKSLQVLLSGGKEKKESA